MRTLTLEDRQKIELMWRSNASPVKIAAELEISQCTVYTELKRGQEKDGAGDVVLDENFRPAYSAVRGETVYRRNLRKSASNHGERGGPSSTQILQADSFASVLLEIADSRAACRRSVIVSTVEKQQIKSHQRMRTAEGYGVR